MNRKLIISPSPHVKGTDSVPSIMYGVVFSLLPALGIAIYFFGISALIVTLTAIGACVIFEFLIQKYLIKGKVTIFNGSAIITGLLLAFNVPSSIPIWMIIVGSLVAIGIGKMSFGGLGANPFNPALVGRVFMLISFPVNMTSFPANRFAQIDGFSGATPLSIAKGALKSGEPMSDIFDKVGNSLNHFVGNMEGSLGEISALFILLGGLYMLYRGIITWHIPVSIFLTVFIFAGSMHLINPEQYMPAMFHILTGGLFLGAIYMATDMVTSPMSTKAMLIYGVGIGALTMIIRTWGAYPEGISFAILIMNAFVPLMNRYIKPKRFGEEVKNG
ncbi:MAG: RnfABCDGE type electron transport complex subunit D [Salinivirgaceae bacterium]|nr:RnfABCDGE type electron transport complex subunit D [Salinivirgaceae bacterium]MDD4745654.1 RnfABCDGE type electron transport complex subunit D [Salinivirgaceae bacterium]MDY0279302.1 RnfABCDGE type electron transport complex subunit D [Salinivirgaceae bacterium]